MICDLTSATICHRDLDRLIAEAGRNRAEICGLLFGAVVGSVARIDTVQASANVARDPATRFEIDPALLIAAHRSDRTDGARFLGCYHSHPAGDPFPSRADAEMAAPDGRLWLILAEGRARAWQARTHGRIHGRFAPVPLTRVT